jgi:hypothetical protein
LEESLGLDISPALASIGTLDDALGQVLQNFSVGLASAISSSISDAGGASGAIDIPVQVDTSQVEGQLSLFDQPIDVPVQADTSTAVAAVDELNTALTDTQTQATDATDALGGISSGAAGLADTAGAATDAAGGLDALSSSAKGVGIATGVAVGDTTRLTDAVGGLGGGFAAAVGAGLAFGAFISKTVSLAADSQAQFARFNQTFGAFADQVQHIDVGGLNLSLDQLAQKSGTSITNLQASASRIGLLGTTSGAAGETVAKVTDQVLALAGTLSVTNPRLGDASQVTDQLTSALIRGGRSLANLGIGITTQQITELAKQIAGAGNTVTLFDKLEAGAILATQQFGNSLGTDFTQGAQNAQVQLRALASSLEDFLAKIGAPLLGPVVQIFQALLPVAEQVGQVLGNAAQIVLPLFTALGPLLVPVSAALKLIGDGLGAIADVVGAIPGPLLAIAAAAALLGPNIALAAAGFGDLAISFGALGVVIDAVQPEFLAIGAALAVIGGLFDIFSGSADNFAKKLGTDLHQALFANVTDLKSLETAVSNITANLTQFISTQNGLIKDAPQLSQAIKDAGLNGKDLAKALEDGGASLGAFQNNLARAFPLIQNTAQAQKVAAQAATDANTAQARQAASLITVQHELDTLKQKYDQNIEAQISYLLITGQVTGAEITAAEANHTHTQALQELTVQAQANADATSQQAIQAAISAGQFQSLVSQFVAGSLSADDFAVKLANYGVSAADAKAITDALTQSINSFVTTAVGSLPSVSTALSDFQQGISSAFQGLLSAQQSGNQAVAAAQKKLNDDLAQGPKAPALSSSLANAEIALQQAQQNLAAAQADGGTNQAAAIAKAQGQVQAAQTRFNDAQRQANDQQLNAQTSFNQTIAQDRQALADATNKSATDIRTAQQKLSDALNPQTFINTLATQITDISTFETNIKKLIAEGLPNLAAALVEQFSTGGASAAAGFAKNFDLAKVANDEITKAANQKTNFGDTLATQLGRSVATAKVALSSGISITVSGALTDGVNQGVQSAFTAQTLQKNVTPLQHLFDEQFTNAATPSAKAINAVASEAAKAGSAATTAFSVAFDPAAPATKALQGLPSVIDIGSNPALVAASSLGRSMTTAFANTLDFKTAIDDGITLATLELKNPKITSPLLTAARALGSAIGVSIIAGIVSGSLTPNTGPPGRTSTSTAVPSVSTGGRIAGPTEARLQVTQTFNEKVDPLHVATELAWRLGPV